MFLKKKWANVSLRGYVATAAISCFFFFVACGDDGSSSSLVTPSDDEGTNSSSSSVILSSSSITQSDSEGSSSSQASAKSSSSTSEDPSSSSVTQGSSSSVEEKTSSNSDEESSSSVSGEQETTCNGVTYDATTHFCASRSSTQERAYRFVTIGTQTWMAENLNYQTENSWCGGGSDKTEGDCATYGRLYTWAAAIGKSEDECGYGQDCNYGSIKVQGVCPDGWHVPKYDELNDLFTAVGGKSTAGQKLKATTLWDAEEGITSEDTYHFAALPAGLYYKGDFSGVGKFAYFWSASQHNNDDAYVMGLGILGNDATLENQGKNQGFSVRCLKN